MRCKPEFCSKQGKVLGIFHKDSMVLHEGRKSFWITIIGDYIIAKAESLDEITKDWNNCQLIFLEESERVGITQFSSMYLRFLYGRKFTKPITPQPICEAKSPLQTKERETLLLQLFQDMESDVSKSQLIKQFKEHKWIFQQEDELGRTVLHHAVSLNNVEYIELIFKFAKEDIDVDHKDNTGATPLHDACIAGYFRAGELLIEHNALIMSVDRSGATPAHYLVSIPLPNNSIIFQFRKLFLVFIENGYAINAQDNLRNSLLHYAAKSSNIGAVNCILDEKPSHLINKHGETALHFAARVGDASICSLLLKSGFLCTIEGENGTPLDVARENNQNEIISLLLRFEKEQLVKRTKELTETIIIEEEIVGEQQAEDGNEHETIIQEKMKQGAFVHRFCLFQLVKSCKCVMCNVRILGNCFACSVCNMIVHEGTCRKEALFHSVCSPKTPELSRKGSNPKEQHNIQSMADHVFSTISSVSLFMRDHSVHVPEVLSESFGLFSSNELNIIYEEYLLADSNGNGIVCADDFISFLGPIYGSPGVGEFIFRMFDTERKGKIEFPEYLQGFAVLFKGTPEEKLRFAFQAVSITCGNPELLAFDVEEILRGMNQVLRSCMNLSFMNPEKFLEDFYVRLAPNGQDLTEDRFVEEAKNHLVFFESLGALLSDENQVFDQQARDKFQCENCISFGHRFWHLIQYLMIGLRISLTEAHVLLKEQNNEAAQLDFNENVKFYLWQQIGKSVVKWTFRDIARESFAKIREMSGISVSSYQFSIGPETILGNLLLGNFSTMTEVSSTGRSGSIFFKTTDNKYLLKTLPSAEVQLLKRILPKYIQHLKRYPGSLLTRFFGIHSIKNAQDNTNIEFVVMENLFCSVYGINEQYDLKGSTADRHVEVEEVTSDIARKDLDFNRKLKLSTNAKIRLLEQVERDCKFLEQHYLCDYSLLVGIHFFEKEVGPLPLKHNDNHLGRLFKKDYGGIMSSDGSELYFIGIIDTLTCYSLQKRSERALKIVLNYERTSISAMSPTPYRKRFQKFLGSIME